MAGVRRVYAFPDFFWLKKHVHSGVFCRVILIYIRTQNNQQLQQPLINYPRDAMLARYLPSSRVPLFICLSVTRRCSTKTAKARITQTTPYDSAGTLVLWCQKFFGGTNHISGTAKARLEWSNFFYRCRLYQVPVYGRQITLKRMCSRLCDPF